MTLADRTITALRATHDQLTGVVPKLTNEQLVAPSAATQWSIADVLSHLGSGAQITLATLQAALDGSPAPDQDFNQSVWDRWNAMSPRDHATGFLAADEELVNTVERLDPQQRQTLQVAMGFLPAPLPLAGFAGMRLNETAQHTWDVLAASDPAATLAPDTAVVLAEHFAGDLGFLTGFISKPDAVLRPAVVEIAGSGFGLNLTDTVALVTDPAQPTATFTGPLEAAMRLITGRLTPQHTPRDVTVTGDVTLDELRAVFPGY